MAKMRVIKRRIKSVNNTRQITKTMEMVATAKIRRAQERIESARPYALQMMEVLANVAARVGKERHPLLEIHSPVKRTVIVPLTSDRGLCGAFNANIIRHSENLLHKEKAAGREVDFVVIGRKGINYFRYMGYQLLKEQREISDKPTFKDARSLALFLINLYVKRDIDRVVLIFNHFKSPMEQKVVEHVLLPIREEAVEEEAARPLEYLFEPNDRAVLYKLLPIYIETLIYRALLESTASEHGARRTAMKAATDNAAEMIENLLRSFNRARQAQITQEIAEIVGGAEALIKEG